jgi:hypothetical protein
MFTCEDQQQFTIALLGSTYWLEIPMDDMETMQILQSIDNVTNLRVSALSTAGKQTTLKYMFAAVQ